MKQISKGRMFSGVTACLGRLGAVSALAALVGCASTPSAGPEAVRSEDGLYEGRPQLIFNTEMPVQSAEEANARATQALREGSTDLALYLYAQAVKLDPQDAESFYMIGSIHEQRANPELAARAYTRVLGLEPEHAPALQGLGIAFFDIRELDSAQEVLSRAVSVDSTLWRAHNVLGVLADSRGDHAAATQHYSHALVWQPRSASILNNRGYSNYLAGDLGAAAEDFLAVVEIDPNYNLAWQNLGLVYARQRKYGMAISTLSHVVSRHAALNDVGYIAMLDGDFDAASRLFDEAIRVSPRYYETAEQNVVELEQRRAEAMATAAATAAR